MKEKEPAPTWRKRYVVVFTFALILSSGFVLQEFFNRDYGEPMNAWYGFVGSLIAGLGIIGLAVADHVSGLYKSRSNLMMVIACGGIFIAGGSISLYYQIMY
ncbi:hypothetical protein [Alkalicoccus chagannorensis]|uniref:hypothetical protein n=1 Tax=Alkalicoccus chagannorensis TaxID=427072 RepID=UPI00047A89D8|nr:hypothetical protein [Alkalicoccus chagannorensis]